MNSSALFMALIVLALFILQGWFYYRILRKAGRSPWWVLSMYAPILLGVGIAIAIPAMKPQLDGILVITVGLVAAIWPILAVWLFSFVKWPTILEVERDLSWEKLADDDRPETSRYFELAATELASETVDAACWGRALALSASESAAKTKYVQLRVVALALTEKKQTVPTLGTENLERHKAREAGDYATGLSIASAAILVLLALAVGIVIKTELDSLPPKTSVGDGKESEPGVRGSSSIEDSATPQAKPTAPLSESDGNGTIAQHVDRMRAKSPAKEPNIFEQLDAEFDRRGNPASVNPATQKPQKYIGYDDYLKQARATPEGKGLDEGDIAEKWRDTYGDMTPQKDGSNFTRGIKGK